MDIHIFTMTYIVNYTPETDDVFVYNQPFTVWPTRQSQVAISENPNLPLKNQTVVYNGETITYDIDLSGIENPYRTNAYFFCSNCFQAQPNWPHCSNLWEYGLGQSGLSNANEPCNLAEFNIVTEPIKTINPTEMDELQNGYVNAQYWNDPNLFHTNVFRANVLIESESDDETYLFALGHPLTTSPCDSDFGFVFFDRETNKLEYRLFTCPCKEWEVPLTGEYCSSGDCVHFCNNCCAPPYSIFTSLSETNGTGDTARLFVMKKGQEPLPKSIKRYKILTSLVRKNDWPIFGIDSSYRFIKARTSNETDRGVYRTREDGNFRFGNNSKNYLNGVNIRWDSGEGDDGPYPSFTITPEGETIFVAFNASYGYSDYISVIDDQTYNQPLTQNVPNPCVEGNIFYKENGKLKVNTYCFPAFFHPELVIPGYPETDIKIYTDTSNRGVISQSLVNRWNYYLEQLGKPKIVSYQFPEFLTPNENYFPDTISETDKKYPLVNSPYLSRESKNSFFPNTNLIDFREKKMLQASELNELQEKFYRKQYSFINHCNKWLSKINLTKQNKDILGFSEKIDLNSITSSVPLNTFVRCSKAIPTENNILILNSRNENGEAEIKLKPCTLMIHTNFGYMEDINDPGATFSRIFYQNIDFIKIDSDTVGVVNLSKITETNIHCITLTLDISNIITCNEYNELRDNSSPDENSSSPCGANRNYISPVNISTIIQQDIDINSEQFNKMLNYNPNGITFPSITPFNAFGVNGIVRYLLGYMKKENGQINFYYANGVKIQNI